MPSILDPLPDVSLHVVEPERVRLERADGRGLSKILPSSTAVAVRFALAGTVAPRVASDRAGAQGVLVSASVRSRHGLPVTCESQAGLLLGLIPTDVDDGDLSSSPTVRDSRARACGGAGIPFVECRLELCNSDRTCDPHLVRLAFVGSRVGVVLGRPHAAPAGRDHDHRLAAAAFPELRARLWPLRFPLPDRKSKPCRKADRQSRAARTQPQT